MHPVLIVRFFMNTKLKGFICGIVSAVTYGMNPLGALSLYEVGINTHSVLFYRYGLAVVILAGFLLVQKKSFTVPKKELSIAACLGVLFAISSLSLFTSFHYMDAGVASTILFVYPVMVAVIMAVFFKEKVTIITAVSILLALSGIGMLYQGGDGTSLSTIGVLLVMVSSLTYALYIIIVNKSSLKISAIKLTLYVMLFGVATIILHSFMNANTHIQLLTTPAMWGWATMLALVPTVISLILMVIAVKAIGSTPTAIMGALKPLTAVVIGVTVFGEIFTLRLGTGIVLILTAVLLIITGKSFHPKKILVRKVYQK